MGLIHPVYFCYYLFIHLIFDSSLSRKVMANGRASHQSLVQSTNFFCSVFIFTWNTQSALLHYLDFGFLSGFFFSRNSNYRNWKQATYCIYSKRQQVVQPCFKDTGKRWNTTNIVLSTFAYSQVQTRWPQHTALTSYYKCLHTASTETF